MWCSSIKKEYDDLVNKSDKSETEVKMLQKQIQDGNANLSKLQKEMECMFNILVFSFLDCFVVLNISYMKKYI